MAKQHCILKQHPHRQEKLAFIAHHNLAVTKSGIILVNPVHLRKTTQQPNSKPWQLCKVWNLWHITYLVDSSHSLLTRRLWGPQRL